MLNSVNPPNLLPHLLQSKGIGKFTKGNKEKFLLNLYFDLLQTRYTITNNYKRTHCKQTFWIDFYVYTLKSCN